MDQISPNRDRKPLLKTPFPICFQHIIAWQLTPPTRVCPLPASVPAGAGPGGGASAPPGGDLPAPAAGAPEQRSHEGRLVLVAVQQQQPESQLWLRPTLQLLHALLPIHAQPRRLEQEHGQYGLLHCCSARRRLVLHLKLFVNRHSTLNEGI